MRDARPHTTKSWATNWGCIPRPLAKIIGVNCEVVDGTADGESNVETEFSTWFSEGYVRTGRYRSNFFLNLHTPARTEVGALY